LRVPNGMGGTGGVRGFCRYPQTPLKRYSFRGLGLRGFRGAYPYCRLRWGMIRHFFGKKVSKPFEKRFKIV
jgi:hypothetical protein